MSLCLVLQHQDKIAIAADNRNCIEKNGEFYHVSDDCKKIHVIGDKIVFTSGSSFVLDNIINKFKIINNKTIENLKNISIEAVNEFNVNYPNVFPKDKRLVELLIACFKNGKSVIYNISSHNDFEVLRLEGNEKTNVIALGCHVDEAMELANEYLDNMNVFKMYECVYNSLSDEQMGGIMHLYILTRNGIEQYRQYKIKDRRIIKKVIFVEDIDQTKIHSNATDGIKIQVRSNTFEEWNDSHNKFYVDTDGNLKLKGHVEIGINNSIFKADNNGIYLGNENIIDAPFSVDLNGNAILNSAKVKGDIDCLSLKISGINILDEVNNIKGDFLSNSSVGIGKLKLDELYVGAGGIRLDQSATISWDQINKSGAIAADVGAIDASYSNRLTKITSTGIYTGTIDASQITTGELTATNYIQIGNQDSTNKQLKMYTSSGYNVLFTAFNNGGFPGLSISADKIDLLTSDAWVRDYYGNESRIVCSNETQKIKFQDDNGTLEYSVNGGTMKSISGSNVAVFG